MRTFPHRPVVVFVAGSPLPTHSTKADATNAAAEAVVDKGKNKVVEDEVMDDDEDEEDEEDEEEDEDEDMAEEEDLAEIDPSAIRSRRTRGVRVDYTSPEALAKAGLKPGEEEDEHEDVYEAKDESMH
ncbi:hypothetical protein EW026_g580 [Hermanssonia centrifuga]|uniref:Histone chaperone domain-containing protein n=1 Tax=Hermanssonia centrifuga TaxID=98765 RepID=A0A4S4KVD0_9APHY|nr:hypothetical protein EW026_g580 [Hermanssonia centrifuga]